MAYSATLFSEFYTSLKIDKCGLSSVQWHSNCKGQIWDRYGKYVTNMQQIWGKYKLIMRQICDKYEANIRQLWGTLLQCSDIPTAREHWRELHFGGQKPQGAQPLQYRIQKRKDKEVIWFDFETLGNPPLQRCYCSATTIDNRFSFSDMLQQQQLGVTPCVTCWKDCSHTCLLTGWHLPTHPDNIFFFSETLDATTNCKREVFDQIAPPGDECCSKMLSVNYKYLTLFLVALAIYLLWMDVSISFLIKLSILKIQTI